MLETYHEFRLEEDEQREFEIDFCENEDAVETDYATVHNFMYQAVHAELEYDSECMDESKSYEIDKFILAPEDEIEKIDLGIDFVAIA